MSDILFERIMSHGPAVRIRRTSEEGATPVTAVLEVDRRAGTTREGIGLPPPLVEAHGETEEAVVEQLKAQALDDAALARLMRERGLR
jgi:hypothetical protein